jgi:methyl-accepting chemotaxis protein
MLQALKSQSRIAFSRLPLAWTMSLLLVLGLVPAAFLGTFFVKQSLHDIAFTKLERDGLRYLHAAWPAYTMATDAKTADTAIKRARMVRPKLESAAQALDGSLSSAHESDIVLRALRHAEQTGDAGAPTGIGALISRIGDQSNLVLDPELDTYYLMTIAVMDMRTVNDAMARAENARDPVEQSIAAAALDDAIAMTSNNIERAIAGNADGTLSASNLRRHVQALKAAAAARLGTLQVVSADANGGQSYVRAREQLWQDAVGHLDRLLSARENGLSNRLIRSLVLCLAMAGLAIMWGAMLIRSLSRGLTQISGRLDALSEGDSESDVPGIELHNDIGVIARALQEFIAQDGERDRLAAELNHAREESQRALETTVQRVNAENAALRQAEESARLASQEAERRAIENLANELEARVSGLLAVTRRAAGAMSEASGSMATIVSASVTSAGEASIAAEQIHDSVDVVTNRVGQIADSLRDLRIRSNAGRSLASEAISSIDTASNNMAAFANAADRIDAMQAMIASVAAQTNMLALNASIEAMRVGEAGQGFMVVANEVKALSTSTRQAAADIGEQIIGMRHANGAVIDSFEAILSGMRELSKSALAISDGIAAQTDGILHVENAMHAANDTVARLTDGIVDANAVARHARDTSGSITETCTHVVDQLATLDSTIADFTSGLKRAQHTR